MGGHNTLNLSVSLHRLHYMLCASYRNSSSEIFSEFHLVERYLGFELSHFPGQGRVLMCGENLQPILVRLAAKLHGVTRKCDWLLLLLEGKNSWISRYLCIPIQ